MTKLSKEKRTQLVGVALATLATVMGIWQMMIAAQKSSIRNTARKVSEQRGRLEMADRLIKALPETQQALEAAQAKLKAAEAQMASGDMYSWVIQTVSKFQGSHTNVVIPQISRETPCEAGIIPKFPYNAVQFALRGTAHYHEFGNFLADLENRFPYMRVQKVELEPAGATSASAAPGAPTTEDVEKLAFRMEIVALVSPNSR